MTLEKLRRDASIFPIEWTRFSTWILNFQAQIQEELKGMNIYVKSQDLKNILSSLPFIF
jgi:hypothetical protein